MVNPHFCSVPASLFFPGVLISLIAPKAVCPICVELWAVTVYKLTFQTTVVIMTTNVHNVHPLIVEIIVQFLGHGRIKKEMLRITWVSLGVNSKSYAVFVKQTVIPKSYVGINWRWSHQKMTVPFSVSCWGTGFAISGWSWSGELDARSSVQRRLVRWISHRTFKQMPQADSWSSPPSLLVGTQHQNWNYQQRPYLIFAVEPNNRNDRARDFHCVVEGLEDCASKKHDYQSCRSWPWTR